jgi:hypothetical protein
MTEQSKTDGRIEYVRIDPHDGYVTGVALQPTQGLLGIIEIHVSGLEEDVLEFARETSMLNLEIVELTAADYKRVQNGPKARLAQRRKYWHAELDALKQIVAKADLYMLADPDHLWQQRLGADKYAQKDELAIDLRDDLQIQFVIPRIARSKAIARARAAKSISYRMLLRLQSTVKEGKRNIYSPINNSITQASATITPGDGDPDLYLYLDDTRLDASINGQGSVDTVSASGEGVWRLDVKGFTKATYVLDGDWILDQQDA